MIDRSVNQRRGRYVVLEGDEGAGKTTDRFESESQEFRRSVNNTYRYFGDNDADFESVDGDRPLQEVAESI